MQSHTANGTTQPDKTTYYERHYFPALDEGEVTDPSAYLLSHGVDEKSARKSIADSASSKIAVIIVKPTDTHAHILVRQSEIWRAWFGLLGMSYSKEQAVHALRELERSGDELCETWKILCIPYLPNMAKAVSTISTSSQ